MYSTLKHFSRLPTTNPQSTATSQIFSSFTQYKFPKFVHVFTYGSKNESGFGTAFYSPALSLSHSYCLPHFISALHAELLVSVVLLSLNYISHTFSFGKFLIIYDLLLAVDSIHQPHGCMELTLAIKIYYLLMFHFYFIFCGSLVIPIYQGINTWID